MVGESGTSKTGAKHNYYTCVGRKRRRDCEKKPVKKDWIEELVVRETVQRVLVDSVIERIADAVVDLQRAEAEAGEGPLLQKQLGDVERSIRNVMLPMIVNATLSRGAQFLAQKKTIVKNLSAIQNLGAIDVLCTDKTGTLTADNIVLQRYLDADGNRDRRILDYVYLNSYFSTGIKNLIDHAILDYGEENGVRTDVADYTKIDEIPFDYDRRRMRDKNSDRSALTRRSCSSFSCSSSWASLSTSCWSYSRCWLSSRAK